MFKEERNKNFPIIQMICDSQGCRKVDLFGNPVKSELKTLMSPEQLKELADREQIQCNNEHSEDEDEIRTSSFEVELGDEFSYICDNYQRGYNDAIEKTIEWLKEKDRMCMFEISMILGSNFIQDFEKVMKGNKL